jgi:ribosome biogenesis GTPase YqeH
MGEVRRVRRCYGCGEVLQSDNPDLPGYADPWEMEHHEIVLCSHCFAEQRKKKKAANEPILDTDFREILKQAKTNKSLIIYVVDLFTFETSFNSEVAEEIKNNPLIVVANKADLLPPKTNLENIHDYVAKRVTDAHLNPLKIILTSVAQNYNIDEVIKTIFTYSEGKDIYFIGAYSSGKSALINSLLKTYKNPTQKYISTSIYPNTTLQVIEIPIDEQHSMYDTPGLSLSNSYVGKMAAEREVIHDLIPKTLVRGRNYFLKSKDALLFGGLAFIEVVSGARAAYSIYMAPDIGIHKTSMSNANEVFERIIRKKLTRPISTLISTSRDLDVYEIKVDYEDKCDIAISGLGWISFVGNHQIIRVYVLNGISIYHGTAKV